MISKQNRAESWRSASRKKKHNRTQSDANWKTNKKKRLWALIKMPKKQFRCKPRMQGRQRKHKRFLEILEHNDIENDNDVMYDDEVAISQDADSILYSAINHQNIELALFALHDLGANPNGTYLSFPYLCEAVLTRNISMVRLLLAFGARPWISIEHINPISLAADLDEKYIFKLLAENTPLPFLAKLIYEDDSNTIVSYKLSRFLQI